MLAALEKAGIEVIQCHEKLWCGIQDRIDTVKGGWINPKFWWRVLKSYSKLIWRFRKVGDFDILMVGYPGQFDVFLAKFLTILKGNPLVWDVFMSIYLIAKERGLNKDHRFILSLVRWIEYIGLRLPDMLIQDTKEYVSWFENEYNLSRNQFRLIPTGADDRIFNPQNVSTNKKDGATFNVLYYGSFIPNHGVMKIAEAINQLRNERDILFRFIGEGPEKNSFLSFIKESKIENVQLFEWMSQENLLHQISEADVCLGAFGDTPQSLMTVQNKIYECLAMGKPIITGDSQAVRDTIPPNTILLCNRDNPDEIADAIIMLKNDQEKRQSLSKNSLELFNNNFSTIKLGQQISNYLRELADKKRNNDR
jgi:glycosyltransferase involved in cell wall biosynthesis